jgi:membrane protein implicated in regulation of membrane protease activity
MNRRKEVAKFVCGAEAFHAFVHAYLWFSGTELIVFGFIQTPTWSIAGAMANAAIAVIVGIYAWGPYRRRSDDGSRVRP